MARILFVTGTLAEPALRAVLEPLGPQAGFAYDVCVLNISVAALMTTPWVARHLPPVAGVDRIMLPGDCSGDLSLVSDRAGVPAERGPRDLRDLPDHFGQPPRPDYGDYSIEILAEINHAPALAWRELLAQAARYRNSGADVIDLGCNPGEIWSGIGDQVRMLRAEGYRVSVDSLNPSEIGPAAAAGAELALSVNRTNLEAARDWGIEVVATPDTPTDLAGLDQVVEQLLAWNIPFRIDPILEPIGFGFAASLGRYLEVRRRYPQAALLMGVGNLTELTDADSAAINVLLAGFCQELEIGSVLTTEVIPWARSSVRELDLARRLVHHACRRRVLPKRVEPLLHLLRDARLKELGDDALAAVARRTKDPNFRIFAERGLIHVFNGRMYLKGNDPCELFEQMASRQAIDAPHAFYLGYEMAKAATALTLGKNYVQDQALEWGFLTVPETSRRGMMKDHVERDAPNPDPPPAAGAGPVPGRSPGD